MKKQTNDDDQLHINEWMNLLDDVNRAEVLKVHIVEKEKTARERIQQEADVKNRLHATEGYHIVRGLFVLFLLVASCAATCVVDHVYELGRLKQDTHQSQ